MKYGILFISLLILLSSCADRFPYLYVEIENAPPYYAGNELAIRYDFVSESDEQPCRIKLWETDPDPDILQYDNQDRDMNSTGTINLPPLNSGNYRFEFQLLSERDGELHELTFLREELYFTVSP